MNLISIWSCLYCAHMCSLSAVLQMTFIHHRGHQMKVQRWLSTNHVPFEFLFKNPVYRWCGSFPLLCTSAGRARRLSPLRHLCCDLSQMLDVLLLFQHLFHGPALPQILSRHSAFCDTQSGSQRTYLLRSGLLCSHHSLRFMDLCFTTSQGNEDRIAPLFCLMQWLVSG